MRLTIVTQMTKVVTATLSYWVMAMHRSIQSKQNQDDNTQFDRVRVCHIQLGSGGDRLSSCIAKRLGVYSDKQNLWTFLSRRRLHACAFSLIVLIHLEFLHFASHLVQADLD